MPVAPFDKQGRYFWHLAKTAGWSKDRVNKLMVQKFGVSHWNVLNESQKKAAITLMRSYAAKGRDAQNKRMRSTIMSLVARNGMDKEWLYAQLGIQEGHTLSKMDYPELVEVYKAVKLMFPAQKRGKEDRRK